MGTRRKPRSESLIEETNRNKARKEAQRAINENQDFIDELDDAEIEVEEDEDGEEEISVYSDSPVSDDAILKKDVFDIFDYCEKLHAQGINIVYQVKRNGTVLDWFNHPLTWVKIQKTFGAGTFKVFAYKLKDDDTKEYVKSQTLRLAEPKVFSSEQRSETNIALEQVIQSIKDLTIQNQQKDERLREELRQEQLRKERELKEERERQSMETEKYLELFKEQSKDKENSMATMMTALIAMMTNGNQKSSSDDTTARLFERMEDNNRRFQEQMMTLITQMNQPKGEDSSKYMIDTLKDMIRDMKDSQRDSIEMLKEQMKDSKTDLLTFVNSKSESSNSFKDTVANLVALKNLVKDESSNESESDDDYLTTAMKTFGPGVNALVQNLSKPKATATPTTVARSNPQSKQASRPLPRLPDTKKAPSKPKQGFEALNKFKKSRPIESNVVELMGKEEKAIVMETLAPIVAEGLLSAQEGGESGDSKVVAAACTQALIEKGFVVEVVKQSIKVNDILEYAKKASSGVICVENFPQLTEWVTDFYTRMGTINNQSTINNKPTVSNE